MERKGEPNKAVKVSLKTTEYFANGLLAGLDFVPF